MVAGSNTEDCRVTQPCPTRHAMYIASYVYVANNVRKIKINEHKYHAHTHAEGCLINFQY